MGAVLVVAIVIGVFFAIGLLVGGIMVIALPLLRDRRPGRSKRLRNRESEPRVPGEDPVQPEYDHVTPDATGREDGMPEDRPRWPGDGESGHSGR